MTTHFHQLKIKQVRRETSSCVSITFDIPAHLKQIFAFTQGQNITLKAVLDGEELRRSYSICSSPQDNELRIAVKQVSGGKFSSWLNTHLQEGSLMDVLPPSGKFYTALDVAQKKNYIAFAAGSGITPILSIIKTTLETELHSRFTLFYGNTDRASIIFKDYLDALKNDYLQRFSVHYLLSREKTESTLYQGRIDEKKCDVIFSYLVDLPSCDELFLCGPSDMIFCLQRYFESKGVEKHKIHFELFTPPNGQISVLAHEDTMPVAAEESSRVNIKSDAVVFSILVPYYGASILDAAVNAGFDLPFACKGGVCATCRAKLGSGEVHMDTNYALEEDELRNGYILTCQSHPRSPELYIDFDAK